MNSSTIPATPRAAIRPWPGRFVSPFQEGRFIHAALAQDVRAARLPAMVGACAYALSLGSELWALGLGARFYAHVGLRMVVLLMCSWFVFGCYPQRNPRSLYRATFVLELVLAVVFAANAALSGFSVVVGSLVTVTLLLVVTLFFPLDPRWTAVAVITTSVLFFVGRFVAGAPVDPAMGTVITLIFAVVGGLGLAQAAALRTARRSAFASIQAERRARLAAERSGRDFRSLFDVAPVPLAISAVDSGEVLRSNRRFDLLFGPPDGRPRVNAQQFYRNPTDHQAFLEEADGPGTTEYSFQGQTLTGRSLELTTSAYPLDYEGRAALLVGFTDQTAERRTAEALRAAKEDAESASQLKTQFLANMSHEIRTPMNGVVAMAGLLSSTELSVDQQEMVEAIQSSGEVLLRIINDILDLSKVEAGELNLDSVPFGVRTLTGDLHAILRCGSPPGVDFEVVVEPDVPEWLCGDPGRLRQVLLNLASNGLKFTPAGRVEVRIKTAYKDRRMVRLVAEVCDTGIGIAPADLESLFLPFTQAHASGSPHRGGTGLGLAISKSLVEMMGGSITVESVLGNGTRFTLEVPLMRATPPIESARPPPRVDGLRRRLSVLVAEDNRVNQMVAQRLLDQLGARWMLARTGREAVEMLRARRFDLVLMDVRMPELDGLEATKWLRRYENQTGSRRTPVIALTAHALSGDRAWCLEAGMDDYLTKPIQPGRLREVLLRWTPEHSVRFGMAHDGRASRGVGPASP